MNDYENNRDAFDKLCGNCAGVDMATVTEADVREMGKHYNASNSFVEAAINGLHEYQSEA